MPHNTYSNQRTIFLNSHVRFAVVYTCLSSHGHGRSRFSALLFQQPSLAHLASSTFLTQHQSSKKNISHISVSNRIPDPQPIWTIKTCQSSIRGFRSSSILTATLHRYIHLKGILVLVFVYNKTHYGFLDISVVFKKPGERPTSDLELVFKDDAGDKQQSKKFKKNDVIYWTLDMSVHVVSIVVLRY